MVLVSGLFATFLVLKLVGSSLKTGFGIPGEAGLESGREGFGREDSGVSERREELFRVARGVEDMVKDVALGLVGGGRPVGDLSLFIFL